MNRKIEIKIEIKNQQEMIFKRTSSNTFLDSFKVTK